MLTVVCDAPGHDLSLAGESWFPSSESDTSMICFWASVLMATLALSNPSQPPEEAAPDAVLKSDPNWKSLATNLWFDAANRHLILRARVVLREGPLEHLLCLKGTKEHEAILASDAPPRQIHAGLLLCGATQGHPVQYVPEIEPPPIRTFVEGLAALVLYRTMPRVIPPSGEKVEIELIWEEAEKTYRADARSWVVEERSRKPLAHNWVFAGSLLLTDPASQRTVYAADDGDLITVANFASAILDLPLNSSSSDAERVFAANTVKIPPLGTEVFVVLKPQKQPPAQKP